MAANDADSLAAGRALLVSNDDERSAGSMGTSAWAWWLLDDDMAIAIATSTSTSTEAFLFMPVTLGLGCGSSFSCMASPPSTDADRAADERRSSAFIVVVVVVVVCNAVKPRLCYGMACSRVLACSRAGRWGPVSSSASHHHHRIA